MECRNGLCVGRMTKPAEIIKKSPGNFGFRNGNPCVKIFGDVSQGSEVGAL